jgi:putative tryptophan/tyrosine transport system substrate-binding protein
MRRRDFLKGISGSAVAWPLAARAQRPGKARRLGVLHSLADSDSEAPFRIHLIRDELQKLGWMDGDNLQIDFRWGGGETARMGMQATELVAAGPDVIFVVGSLALSLTRQKTRDIPIVFANVSDPVVLGLVASLARPGGNVTGVALFEPGIGGKWLELLKQIAPRVARVLVIRGPDDVASDEYIRAMKAIAGSFAVNIVRVDVTDIDDLQAATEGFAHDANGGLIVLPSPKTTTLHPAIVAQAARNRLPAIYPYRYFVTGGGLMSYSINQSEQYRQALTYVDRILRGASPAALPVQLPTTFELTINLKTAAALGLEVPLHLQQLADEVIE